MTERFPASDLAAAATAAAPLPALLLAAERVAATVSQGAHGRRRPGPGESFWQFRRLEPGEDGSRIDWRRSARSDHLYVREREWEAAQGIWLWCDGSPSMAWSSAPVHPTKGQRGRVLLLALAILLMRAGERVSVLGSALAPASSRLILPLLAQHLMAESTDLPALPARLPRHARMVLVSDFLRDPDAWTQRLTALGARGIRGHLVQVLDGAEEALPYAGRVRFQDAETGETLLLPRAEATHAAYVRRLDAHRATLARLAQSQGWSWHQHRTDAPPSACLLALHAGLGRGEARLVVREDQPERDDDAPPLATGDSWMPPSRSPDQPAPQLPADIP